MQQQVERDLVSLPKAELHLHLEGAMRRSTLVDLCAKHGISPVPEDMSGKRFDGFGAFVDVYLAACECLRSEQDIYRLMLEVAEDAKLGGAKWIEVAPSFTFYAKYFGGPLATLQLLAKAAETTEISTGVGIGLIVSIERQLGTDAAEDLARLVQQASNGITICGRPAVVGFGCHGPEEGFPPAPFARAFEIACGSGKVASVPHAGEIAPFPGKGAESVMDAVNILKAKRLGHGVLAHGDEQAMKVLLENQICLDVCPSSNYFLKVVSSREEHPLRKLIQFGIPCTINADDPLLFGCDLLGEYKSCQTYLQMDDEMLAQCAKDSFRYSSAPKELVTKNLEAIDRWLAV
mmetsp:Transcript_22738/g.56324  ORF Transcript_22738/g.56324 Transcript_22738/m.56324 type:complete len:348 (-) Transcript_22738:1426-2469(-)